jgi:hypothetical protein
MKKIILSDVLKGYLRTAGYILLFGVVALISKKYLKTNEDLNLVFGGLADFITYVLVKEIKGEGVVKAINQ